MIELRPVDAALREAVLALAPLPEQEGWSGRASHTLPMVEADPTRHPVAIVRDGTPVGFFTLDEGDAGRLGLRGFYVDAAAQGSGVASAALRALPSYVAEHFPAARRVALTVNVENPVALRVYLANGFRDTGELHLGGALGPQHVLVMDLSPAS